MKRLDFYVQHMLRQSATSIVIQSDAPVEFHLASGKARRSNQPISHNQVMQLVREVASADALDQLRAAGRARFSHAASDGAEVQVLVSAASADSWRVVVATGEAPQEDAPARSASQDSAPDNGGFVHEPSSAVHNIDAPLPPLPPLADKEPAPSKSLRPGMPPAPPRERPLSRSPSGPRRPSRPPARPKPVPPPSPPAGGRLSQAEVRLSRYLRAMLQAGASDLHLSSGAEPVIRIDGEIGVMDGSTGPLRPDDVHEMMMSIAPADVRKIFEDSNDADFAYEVEGLGRFRMNYFVDRRGPGLVARQIPLDVLPPEQLGLPPSVIELCWLSKGLVLITGPTGSGKSTTLASLIDFINRNRSDHIITIEDPIEYVHPNRRCLVNQRQVGVHTGSFSQALRAALREDPDVVVVGEMRDVETISIAIETAETGHLVFGTLHTTTAPSTVDRIIDQFPAEEQGHIRSMLAESLRGVVSQVLCKRIGGGRVAAYEVLLANSAAQNLIREGKIFQLKSLLQTGKAQGMQHMNDHLLDLVKTNTVEVKDAYVRANDKASFRELLQKARITLDPNLMRSD